MTGLTASSPGFTFSSRGVHPEVVVDSDMDDPRVWVPVGEGMYFRPLMFDVMNGAWTSLIKVDPGAGIGGHYHTQQIHGFTLKGSWHYRERDWVSRADTYICEPAGDMHTFVGDEQEGMTALFLMRGAMIFTDPDGQMVGYQDVFTRLETCRRHFAQVGLGTEVIDAMVR